MLCVSLLISMTAVAVISSVVLKPMCAGDGHEYVLDLEAWLDHGSPDIRPADVDRLIKSVQGEPSEGYDLGLLNQIRNYLQNCKLSNGSPNCQPEAGIYKDRWGRFYGYHAPFYSLLALPVDVMLKALAINDLDAFAVTNALIICVTLAYVLLWSTLCPISRVCAAILWALGGTVYYLGWPHPEIFLSGLLLIAGLAIHDRRYGLAMAATGAAALQFPPAGLLALPLFVAYGVFWQRSLKQFWSNPRVVAGAAAGLILTLASPLFYFIHFHKWSLTGRNFDLALVTPSRVESLFFDLNQGMLAGAPGVLIGAFILFVLLCAGVLRLLAQRRPMAFRRHVWLLAGICMLSLPMAGAINWNAGCAVFQRYAYWLVGAVLAWVITAAEEANFTAVQWMVLPALAVLQGLTVVYYNPFHLDVGSEYLRLKPAAHWVLLHLPALYDPDPAIFARRVGGSSAVYTEGTYAVVDPARGVYTKVLLFEPNYEQTLNQLCGTNAKLVDLRKGVAVNTEHIGYSGRHIAYLSGRFACECGVPFRASASAPEFRQFAERGFGETEPWGTWTVGQDSYFQVHLAERPRMPVSFSLTARLFEGYLAAHVDVIGNGTKLGQWSYDGGGPVVKRSVVVDPSLIRGDRILTISLHFAEPVRNPAELGVAGYLDRIGLACTGFELNPLVEQPVSELGPGNLLRQLFAVHGIPLAAGGSL